MSVISSPMWSPEYIFSCPYSHYIAWFHVFKFVWWSRQNGTGFMVFISLCVDGMKTGVCRHRLISKCNNGALLAEEKKNKEETDTDLMVPLFMNNVHEQLPIKEKGGFLPRTMWRGVHVFTWANLSMIGSVDSVGPSEIIYLFQKWEQCKLKILNLSQNFLKIFWLPMVLSLSLQMV